MKKIACFAPEWGDEERSCIVQHVIREKFITAGKAVNRFEAEFGKRHGRYAIMTNSGSSALLLATMALNLPHGSKIITPAVTFPTTISPLLILGHVPVFVDVDPGTYNISLESMNAAIASVGIDNIAAAIIPHTLGNPVAPAIWEQFPVTIEDACDALDSTVGGRLCGTFGTYSTFSFFPAHHLCTGEGGVVLSRSKPDHDELFKLCNWGRKCICRPGYDNTCGKRFDGDYDCKYTFHRAGFNLKPLDLQGKVGLLQLDKQERMTKIRKRNFEIVSNYLDSLQDRIILPESLPDANPNWFGFPITLKKGNRNQIVKNLEAKGIQTRLVFAGNITRQKMMEQYKYIVPNPLIQSDIVMDNAFIVGIGPTVTEADANRIGRCIYEEAAC